MSCECLKDVTERLVKHYKPEAGDDIKIECLATAIVLDDTCSTRLFIPFRLKGSKPGYKSAKGKTTHMLFSHCPFCGVKYEAEK